MSFFAFWFALLFAILAVVALKWLLADWYRVVIIASVAVLLIMKLD